MQGKYKIVTLCGSTRFKDEFLKVQKELTLKGYIVNSVGLFGHSGDDEVLDDGVKEMLDEMHLAKIDMADEIFVVNPSGYVGESTSREIAYARNQGKPVRSLCPLPHDGSSGEGRVNREAFGECTSMSCLEASGAMHTFIVAYREHPSRLEIDTRSAQSLPSFSPSNADGGPSASFNFEEISSMKQELYHIGTRGYGIDILCENIFVKDDVLFLLISLKNGSSVSYELSAPRFAVESKRHTKRGLQYEKAVFPKQSYGLGVVQPEDVGKLVFTFDKIALTRGQVFRVYFYEKGGARNLVLTLSQNDINGAKRLN